MLIETLYMLMSIGISYVSAFITYFIINSFLNYFTINRPNKLTAQLVKYEPEEHLPVSGNDTIAVPVNDSLVAHSAASAPVAKCEWMPYRDLAINAHFFKRGLVLVSTNTAIHTASGAKKDSFYINDREFFIIDPSTPLDKPKPNKSSIKITRKLLEQLTSFSALLGRDIKTYGERIALFNKRHRDEIFLPIVLTNAVGQQQGFYLYPWVSKRQNPFSFSGFNQYVTACCLFGASLKGIDQFGNNFALMNHVKLVPGQQIKHIQYDESISNPYEQMLFLEVAKQCALIVALANPKQTKKLLFHLPAYDYIVFGIKLFIHNHLSREKLDQFIQLIFLTNNRYQKAIGAICAQHEVEVSFASPFDNLFGKLDSENVTQTILTTLNIVHHDDTSLRNCEAREEAEAGVLRNCLTKLQTNTHNDEHRDVWLDFLTIDAKAGTINSIESLLKIANAVLIAIAARGSSDYEVCSLLPLSEKQIQVNYDSYSKKQSGKAEYSKNKYPAIFNITFFEPLLAYSETTNGLLFYFSAAQKALSSLIADQSILRYANNNVRLFFDKKQDHPTEPDFPSPIKIQHIV